MSDVQRLVNGYRTTQWLIEKQTAGLSHDDSVRQLPFRGNCLNWVLGHLASSRERALQLLGGEPVLEESEKSRYATGSPPVVGLTDAVPLARLQAALQSSQSRIVAALDKLAADDLGRVIDEESGRTLGQHLSGLHWHETYHVGQLELLRQLAGTDDAIV